jgi:hypothetical protein
MMPTSSDGWMVHIKGVAAMMQSRGPLDFKDGIPHLLFVGFRPLIVRTLHNTKTSHCLHLTGIGITDKTKNHILDGQKMAHDSFLDATSIPDASATWPCRSGAFAA